MSEAARMRHLPDEMLLDHASGRLDLPMRVVVEAHLELCPQCRGELAAFAAPGGWLLTNAPTPEPPPEALWQRIEGALPDPGAGGELPAEIPLPAAARRELPAGLTVRWWRHLLGGARMARLVDDAASGSGLFLGYMPGGLRFPRHEHLGFEHAVVLAGGYEDERGEFVAGDFALYEPGSEHGPQTLDGDDCWILFRVEGEVRFRGWRGALQRLLV
jgi:putative transcriptional regulator